MGPFTDRFNDGKYIITLSLTSFSGCMQLPTNNDSRLNNLYNRQSKKKKKNYKLRITFTTINKLFILHLQINQKSEFFWA